MMTENPDRIVEAPKCSSSGYGRSSAKAECRAPTASRILDQRRLIESMVRGFAAKPRDAGIVKGNGFAKGALSAACAIQAALLTFQVLDITLPFGIGHAFVA